MQGFYPTTVLDFNKLVPDLVSSRLSANEISEGQLCMHQSSCMAVTTAA